MKNLNKYSSQELRAELQTRGFFTENLWHVNDVMDRFDCDEEKALEILCSALENQFTIESIFEIINQYAEGLKENKL